MIARLEPQLHNQIVSYVLNNMTELPHESKTVDYVKSQVQSYFDQVGWGEMPDISLPEFPSDFNEVDLHSWIDNWMADAGASSSLQSYFHQLVDATLSGTGLREFYITTQNLISSAENELNPDELQVFVDSCNVGNHSLAYWIGESQGKRIWTAGLIINPPGPDIISAIKWWKVGACDLVGAGGGALLGGPKGAVVGAGVASLCSIINQW